jgi:electron transport complex protein RnfD
MNYILLQLFSGSFLFVALFIATDPITTPISNKGKIIYGVIAGALTMIIRHAGTNSEGVYFAIGFMMMLTPMLNQAFNTKPKKKAPPKKEEV